MDFFSRNRSKIRTKKGARSNHILFPATGKQLNVEEEICLAKKNERALNFFNGLSRSHFPIKNWMVAKVHFFPRGKKGPRGYSYLRLEPLIKNRLGSFSIFPLAHHSLFSPSLIVAFFPLLLMLLNFPKFMTRWLKSNLTHIKVQKQTTRCHIKRR